MRFLVPVLLLFLHLASSAAAQTRSVADLANYRGADREEMLKAGARKEGKLVWYTTLTAHRDIANVFESHYPGIKVETYRTGSTDLLRRIMASCQRSWTMEKVRLTWPSWWMN